jgi:anti-sigma factor RsiW
MTQALDGGRQPISEVDLHGYIDGELTAQRYAEVEAYLALRPDHAARLAEYGTLTLSLHRLFDVPQSASRRIEALTEDLDRALRRRRTANRLLRLAVAAIVLMVIAGLASSVHDRFRQAEDRFLAFTQQATDAHILFAGAKPAEGEEDLAGDVEPKAVSWLSQRLTGVPGRAPDLRPLGYDLTVERILPTANGPAAQLMYESAASDQPVTLFIGKSKDKSQTAFTYVQNDDLSIFYWQEGPFAYSLAGKLEKFDLLTLAEEVNAQLVALPPMPKAMVQRRAVDASPATDKPVAASGPAERAMPAAATEGATPAKGEVLRPVSKKLEESIDQPADVVAPHDPAGPSGTKTPEPVAPVRVNAGESPKKT